MRRLLPFAAVAALLAGCGGASHRHSAPAHPVGVAQACSANPETRIYKQGALEGFQHTFGRMGLCVGKRYGFAQPLRASYAEGLDISVYQGLPDWSTVHAHGVRFVWNQSSDAYFTDWNFITNWCREKAHGIIPGGYIFLRPGSGFSQGRYLAQRILAARHTCGGGSELPPLLDAEVGGAYEVTASAADGVRGTLGNVLVDTYTSPGLWGGCCRDGTGLDEAIWGGPGYLFGGWSSYNARQYCGTCYFPGVGGEVDLQSDHGVLGLIRPPESPAEHKVKQRKRLYALYGVRERQRANIRALHNVLARHRCHHGHKGGRCRKWKQRGDAERRAGAGTNRKIAQLHREGIY